MEAGEQFFGGDVFAALDLFDPAFQLVLLLGCEGEIVFAWGDHSHLGALGKVDVRLQLDMAVHYPSLEAHHDRSIAPRYCSCFVLLRRTAVQAGLPGQGGLSLRTSIS